MECGECRWARRPSTTITNRDRKSRVYLSSHKNRVSKQSPGEKRPSRTQSTSRHPSRHLQARAPPTTATAGAGALLSTSAYLARWTGTSIPSILSSHQSLSSVNPVELASESLRAKCPRLASKSIGFETGLVISSYPAESLTGSANEVSLVPAGGRRGTGEVGP